jgi:AcrR family transcriptional regulator
MARPPNPAAREALLEAARIELAAHGLAAARVEDIARRAGLSKGAFYLHFATKEQVFEELLQRFFGAMADQIARRQEAEERFIAEHAGVPAPDLLEAQIAFECDVDGETIEALWRNRFMIAILDSGGPRYAALLHQFRRSIHALTARRIADKQAAGRMRADVDPAVVADLIAGTYEWLARRMVEMTVKPDLLAWTRSFLHVVYDGMRVRSAPARASRTASSRPARPRRAAPRAGRAPAAR